MTLVAIVDSGLQQYYIPGALTDSGEPSNSRREH